jgi:hypothetical protein
MRSLRASEEAMALWQSHRPTVPVSVGPEFPESKRHQIGNTPYYAHLGLSYLNNPERTPAGYTILIMPQLCGNAPSIPVLFQQSFRFDELPDGFLERSPEEIVSYNPTTRVVTFHVGEKPATHKLP